jgi:branched-chain amino acid transport system substrate-binding protein
MPSFETKIHYLFFQPASAGLTYIFLEEERGMNKKLFSILSMLVLASLALAACQPAAPEVASLKVGEMHPFTGPLSEFGEPEHNAALLAAKQLEEAGYKIETVFGDTETSAIPAVEAARRLVEVEGVQVIIGAAASGVTIPIAESVTIPNQVPQISYASTSPLLTALPSDRDQDFLFRTCPSDALQGPVLAKMIWDEGLRTVATMYVNNPYGQGLNDQFKLAFEDMGGTVTAEVPHDEEAAVSYTAELAQATEGNPEVLIAISYPGHASIYLKEAIEGGFIDEFRFVDGTKSEDIPAAVGADALEGMCGTAPGSKETESLATFNSTYEAEYGEIPPLPFMTTTYDAVIIAGLAAYEAQIAGEELTGVAVRDHLRSVAGPPGELVFAGTEGLTRALELLRAGEQIDYVGAAGDVDFDGQGDVLTPIDIWCYVGGVATVKETVSP